MALSKRLTWIFLCFNSSPLICTPARALPVSHNYDFCPICGFLFPSLIGKMEDISNSVPQMQQKMGSFLTLLPRTPLRRCFCPDSRLNPQDGYTQIRHHPPPPFKRRQAQPNRTVFLGVAGGHEGVLHNASGQRKTSESPVRWFLSTHPSSPMRASN